MTDKEVYMTASFASRKFNIRKADSFGSRLMGLMGVKSLPKGHGLLLTNCGSIHCCFMRFTIDVIYLDKNNKVVAVETVKPWHLGKILRGVKNVLEVNQGEAEGIHKGDEMIMEL
jgi:uncharacterized membrane protein (UPF0127 family)